MKNQGRYRHLRVDWVGESSSESITLCGVEGETERRRSHNQVNAFGLKYLVHQSQRIALEDSPEIGTKELFRGLIALCV